jgi:hypothetical protein
MKNSFRTLAVCCFAPVGLASAYVLNAWVESGSSPFAIGRALLIAIMAALAIAVVAVLFIRDYRRATIVATGVVAIVIFGRDLALVVGNVLRALPFWQLGIMLGLIGALAVAVWMVMRRTGSRMVSAASLIAPVTAAVVVLLLSVLVSAVSRGLVAQAPADLRQNGDVASIPDRSSITAPGPDIYVILLDGYPRADVLETQFGYDNSPFLRALTDRGLDVAKASHSNYTLTEYTLLSMLNMRLLQDIPELDPVFAEIAPGQPTSRKLLTDNPTVAALRERSYLTVGFAGSYEDVSPRLADLFLQTDEINEVEWALLANTFLLDVLDWVAPEFLADQQRAFVNSSFSLAEAVAKDRSIGPRFVMAHVFAPRTPLVFGPNGEELDLRSLRRVDDTAAGAGLDLQEYGARLVGQVQYVNGRTLELIDTVLASSAAPPIIIVMSDHGSRSEPLDPRNPDPELVRERFGSLFAAYTPGHPGLFPDDVAPVEVMGRLLNTYFGVEVRDPGGGIFTTGNSQYDLIQLGDAPPTPSP